MYQPISVKVKPQVKAYTSITPIKGENTSAFSALLTPEYALEITNYIPQDPGMLVKRGGQKKVFDQSTSDAILLDDRYTPTVRVVCYGTNTDIWDESTDTVTTIKSDWTDTGLFTGVGYGDYYFLCNGSEKIHRISQTLAYDTQTANFATGLVLTGATSGATATILQDSDSGATGTLTLGNVQGTFVDNEIITDSATGSATVNGTLTYAITSISAAPICSVLSYLGSRLIAGNLSTDSTAVQYSEVDTGSNPPFSTWSNTTTATDGGKVYDRTAGTVRAIATIGDVIVAFSDNGKWAFRITQVDSGGTIKKIDQVVIDRIDLGGASALSTNKGICYVNESGIHLITSLGQSNVPLSDQDFNVSTVLNHTYWDDIDFTGSAIAYDRIEEIFYISCKKSSSANNYIIGWNTKIKGGGFFRFKNWSINTFFMDNDGSIYGGSSVYSKIYKLFVGSDDDGTAIGTSYTQELTGSDLNAWKDLKKFAFWGEASASTTWNIVFDTSSANGRVTKNAFQYQVSAQYNTGAQLGYGIQPWGSGYGENGASTPGLIPIYDTCKKTIRGFSRIKVRITEGSTTHHVVNMFQGEIYSKSPIRVRNITQVTN